MKLKGIEIEPGMVIETTDDFYIAFPTKITDYPMAFIMIYGGDWTVDIYEDDIVRIMDLTTELSIGSGKVLWDKNLQSKELSMEEIAEKFGIPVEQLRIKKE